MMEINVRSPARSLPSSWGRRSPIRPWCPGGRAFLPAFGEQVEVYVLLRVRLYNFLVQLQTQARSLRQREVAVHHLWEAGRRLLNPGVGEVVEVLLDAEV